MNNKIISSRKQYKSFIKNNGLFSFKRKKEVETNYKKTRSLFSIIVRLLKEFKEQRFRLTLVIAIGFLVNITAAAFPWAGKYMIDTILPQKSTIFLMAACVILMFIGIIDVILNYSRDYISNAISGTFSIAIKNRMMRHLQKLPLLRIQELKVGGIISRLQEDTDAMSGLLFETIVSPLNAIVMLVIALSSLFLINWKVSLLCMIFSLCSRNYWFFSLKTHFTFTKYLFVPIIDNMCQTW
jgi:ABC-type bacteriocin/lantibiotic exporter with double-glycine peptidase domain